MKVPVEHKGLAESMQSMVDATVAAVRSSRGGHAVEYAATEKAIAERTAAIERAAHAEVLRSGFTTGDKDGTCTFSRAVASSARWRDEFPES